MAARSAVLEAGAPLTYAACFRVSRALSLWPRANDAHHCAAFGSEGERLRPPHAATAVTLLNVERNGRAEAALVLTVRGGKMRSHAGEISLPGGHIDASDASPADAAMRELREETGVRHASLLGRMWPAWSRYGKVVQPHVVRPATFCEC